MRQIVACLTHGEVTVSNWVPNTGRLSCRFFHPLPNLLVQFHLFNPLHEVRNFLVLQSAFFLQVLVGPDHDSMKM